MKIITHTRTNIPRNLPLWQKNTVVESPCGCPPSSSLPIVTVTKLHDRSKGIWSVSIPAEMTKGKEPTIFYARSMYEVRLFLFRSLFGAKFELKTVYED